jgi:ATP-dependent Clp protease protease subunit
MSNTQQDNRILMLGTQVYQSSVGELIKQIISYNMQDDYQEEKEKGYVRKPITLIINSYGGSAYDGWALINAIETSNTPIIGVVIGSAMSMALAVFVACHQRIMGLFSTLMYHEVASGVDGNLTEIKQTVEEMERMQDQYDAYLIDKTKLVEEKLMSVRQKKDNWYINSEEAMKYGIADGIMSEPINWVPVIVEKK